MLVVCVYVQLAVGASSVSAAVTPAESVSRSQSQPSVTASPVTCNVT